MMPYRLYLHYLRLKHIRGNKGWVNFLDREWDYAIVLDACRYDVFKQCNSIKGKLSKIISPGSHTIDWIKKCMKDNHKDIVFLTASPHFSDQKLKEYGVKNCFYKTRHLWDLYYNSKIGVVHPDSMIEEFNIAKLKYPDKRFLLWFMQPHRPFIINKAESWSDYDQLKDKYFFDTDYIIGSWSAYLKNFLLVQSVIKKLLPKMKGKVIVTSDHGNLFGEYKICLHPRKLHVPELVEVPYLEVNNV